MACYSPLHGFRAPGGGIKTSRSGAYRDRPVTVKCGNCIGCRIERRRWWALRCTHEASLHQSNCFLTLTYNDDNVPPDGSLDVSHWQEFAQRLRNTFGPFRYYHCGEYGEKGGRLHLHASIFGLDFSEGREKIGGTNDKPEYTHPELERIWGRGFVHFTQFNPTTASYVAGYIMKKVTGLAAPSHYGGAKPEYATMSRRPGIGQKWIERYLTDVYPRDFVIFNGKQMQPPPFYDTYLQKQNPQMYDQVKAARVRAAAQILDKNDQTPDRLEVREICAKAKASQKQRTL